MPTSNAEELGLFLKCTVIGRGVFGPCACCKRPPPNFLREYDVILLSADWPMCDGRTKINKGTF